MAEFWSNSDRGYRIRLWIDQLPHNQNNISNNNSQVRVRLALLNTTTTFAQYSCSAWVDLNERRLNWSGSPNMTSYNSTIMLIDETITIGHNADGTKSFGLSASFSGSGGWSPGTLTINGNSFTLSTIPRSSSVTVSSGTIGSAVTININRQSSSFKHTLRYQWGNKAGTIASNVDTSTNWMIPDHFANDIPNSTSGTGTIYIDTYNGGTKTGTQSVSFTASVPASMKPTFSSLTLTDTNGVARGLLSGNNFLQVISNIQVNFNGASGAYSSTITGYKAEIVNKNQVTNSNGGTLGIMNFNGSATVRASVFDSRGRQSDAKDITINVIEYFAPIFSFTALRTRASPNIIQVIRNARISPISLYGNQKNVMTLSFKVAPLGSTYYTSDNGSASGVWTSVSNLTNSQANLSGNYIATKSFVVIGTLSDKFTSTEFSATVATESVVMSYDKDGRVGIGKIVEQGRAGSIDVAGDGYIGGKFYVGNNEIKPGLTKTEILDMIYPVGSIYISISSSNPSYTMGGTWQRFANGKTLVGVDEYDSDFNSPNRTGGEKAHQTTVEEMPSHAHQFNTEAAGSPIALGWENGNNSAMRAKLGNYTMGLPTTSVGGNKPHNNLQPYITVYMWRRTA
ncbi:capsid and scaffold protein [Streptococcus phage Javan88]|nr:capsid and scaffold protein [Streptococcus phage Javan91]QBX31988.1 capsid and scaffold protein [Streptococcus phage Javan88]